MATGYLAMVQAGQGIASFAHCVGNPHRKDAVHICKDEAMHSLIEQCLHDMHSIFRCNRNRSARCSKRCNALEPGAATSFGTALLTTTGVVALLFICCH